MNTEIEMQVQKELFELQDKEYREFHGKLIPNVDPERIIGVRTPVLRKYAQQFAKAKESEAFLQALPHRYYEENNLQGFLIERMKDYDTCVAALDEFLPYVDNWATCDSISPKVFPKHLEELKEPIRRWISSGDTYVIRFGIGMLMKFYLDDAFRETYLGMVAKIHSQEYYVRMMQAWYYATALAKQYDTTLPYIKEQRLDTWVHNKSIQKAIESSRITPEQKSYLRTLKIK